MPRAAAGRREAASHRRLAAALALGVGTVAVALGAQDVRRPPDPHRGPPPRLRQTGGAVAALPAVLNDDGGWCWFQDERAVVVGERLVFGSVASGRTDPSRRTFPGQSYSERRFRAGSVRPWTSG